MRVALTPLSNMPDGKGFISVSFPFEYSGVSSINNVTALAGFAGGTVVNLVSNDGQVVTFSATAPSGGNVINANTQIEFELKGRLRLPSFAAPNTPAVANTFDKDMASIDSVELPDDVEPSDMPSVLVVPALRTSRAGVALDTRGKNTARLTITPGTSIPADGFVVVELPAGFSVQDMCNDKDTNVMALIPIRRCISSAVCVFGCTGQKDVMRSVSGFVLDASLQAKFMVGHSIAVNLSMATDFSAGSNLVLDLNGFAVPAFLPNTSVQTSGDFKVATMRSDGRLIEVGTAQGFTIAPAKFQAVAVVNVTAASVISNCSVPQPVFLLSDSSVGAVSEFQILSFKTTNQIPLNGSIEFQFPPTLQSFCRV